MLKQKVFSSIHKNADGSPKEIVLNEMEQAHADYLQDEFKRRRLKNSLGFEINITTLTAVSKKVSEQKFFEEAPSECIPIIAGGEGAYATSITTFREFLTGDSFETGIINNAGSNQRLSIVNAAVDSVNLPVFDWAKGLEYNIFQLAQAMKSGNWNLVTAKEKSRKKNWDLGIQLIAFLGIKGSSTCNGLFTLPGVTNDTTFMSGPLSGMAPVDLKAFCAGVLNAYRVNCNYTAMPTHFVIPESDYLGLAAPVNPDFAVKSVKQMLEETFQEMTGNKGFKIVKSRYGDAAVNAGWVSTPGNQRYVLLNYDEESIKMHVPVPYNNTLANTLDSFFYQNVGFGQFTGVQAVRPQEVYYFTF